MLSADFYAHLPFNRGIGGGGGSSVVMIMNREKIIRFNDLLVLILTGREKYFGATYLY
jgi:hypothetical protein